MVAYRMKWVWDYGVCFVFPSLEYEEHLNITLGTLGLAKWIVFGKIVVIRAIQKFLSNGNVNTTGKQIKR